VVSKGRINLIYEDVRAHQPIHGEHETFHYSRRNGRLWKIKESRVSGRKQGST